MSQDGAVRALERIAPRISRGQETIDAMGSEQGGIL
jgi:hypothetical protein